MNSDLRCPNPACRAAYSPGALYCPSCGQTLAPPPPPGSPPPAIGPGARPGGLTALAVINFVLAALGCVGALGAVAVSALFSSSLMDNPDVQAQIKPEDQEQIAHAKEVFSHPLYPVHAGVEGVNAILLVIAGVGYLRMKRVTGRIVGNVYAVLAIANEAFGITLIPASVGAGMGLALLPGFLYPLLTLFFINVTFRNELVN